MGGVERKEGVRFQHSRRYSPSEKGAVALLETRHFGLPASEYGHREGYVSKAREDGPA